MKEEIIIKLMSECNETVIQTLNYDFYSYLLGCMACVFVILLIIVIGFIIHKKEYWDDDARSFSYIMGAIISLLLIIGMCFNVNEMVKIKLAPKAYIFSMLTKLAK